MKSANLYAKKTLSVFMAVLMLLSAWAFVPGEYNHASAADTACTANEEGKHDYLQTYLQNGNSCVYPTIYKFECKNCGYSYTETVYEGVTAHKWGEWYQNGGSCITGIVEVKECQFEGCDAEEIRIITKDNHKLVEKERVEPTCTDDGYVLKICTVCAEEIEETLPSPEDITEHTIDEEASYKVLKKADCITAELREYTCTVCNAPVAHYVGNVIGHTWISQSAVAPTCEFDGCNDHYKCAICEVTFEKVVYKATGHTDSDGNGKCDVCSSVYYEGGNKFCSCMCHKEGRLGTAIYKVLRFFWKLFGTNISCDCGKVHY